MVYFFRIIMETQYIIIFGEAERVERREVEGETEKREREKRGRDRGRESEREKGEI